MEASIATKREVVKMLLKVHCLPNGCWCKHAVHTLDLSWKIIWYVKLMMMMMMIMANKFRNYFLQYENNIKPT